MYTCALHEVQMYTIIVISFVCCINILYKALMVGMASGQCTGWCVLA